MSARLQVFSGHLNSSPDKLVNMSGSLITTHVLDTSRGCPAAGVPVQVSFLSPQSQDWDILGAEITDKDGRCGHLLASLKLRPGTYKVHFDTGTYFSSFSSDTPFYPYADVVFNLRDTTQHYHIPLLLSNFSYSTYRGS